MKSLFSSLRFRLAGLILLTVSPMLVFSINTYSEQMRMATSVAQSTALNNARLAAKEQERLYEGARQVLVALALLPAVLDTDATACSLYMAELLPRYPNYENIGAALPDGKVFCSAVPSEWLPNIADRPVFQRSLQTRGFVIAGYLLPRITRRPASGVLYPALDEDGHLRAVVFAGIDLDWLDSFLMAASLPEGSSLDVIDSAGTILTRYPDPERWRGTVLPKSVIQAFVGHTELVSEGEGLDGVPRLYGVSRLSSLTEGDIYVRVGIPAKTVAAHARSQLMRNIAALTFATVLATLAAWKGSRHFLLGPLEVLMSVIRRFEAGETAARVGSAVGSGEISYLAGAIDQMATTIEARVFERDRAAAALERHAARAEALAATSARLNAHHDLQKLLDLVCAETARALGVSAASVSLAEDGPDAPRIGSAYGLPEGLGQQLFEVVSPSQSQPTGTGEPFVVRDVQALGGTLADSLLSAHDIRSAAGTAMVHDGRLVGMLHVYERAKPRQFSEGELCFLKAMSDQAAQAIVNVRLYEAVERERVYSAALLERTIRAQEDERMRIARELHDETSQDLAALLLNLDACALGLATDAPTMPLHMESAKTIARVMLAKMNRLINDLRPSLLDDLGLPAAIEWYGEERLRPMGIELRFRHEQMVRLSPAVEIALFRVAQEALANVVKHAGATKVDVDLTVQNGTVFLAVVDDGCGIGTPTSEPGDTDRQRLGLRGMQERVIMFGGKLVVESSPAQGTAIRVTVPVLQAEAQ